MAAAPEAALPARLRATLPLAALLAATEFEPPGVAIQVARSEDARSMRDLRVREIAAAEARLGGD